MKSPLIIVDKKTSIQQIAGEIESIKQKYKAPELSEKDALKLKKLDIANNILKTATKAAGILTFFDIIIPDGIPLIDEALLAALTALLKSSQSIVGNKIDAIINSEKSNVSKQELDTLASNLTDIIYTIQRRKTSSKQEGKTR